MENNLKDIGTEKKYYKIFKEDYFNNNQKKLYGVFENKKTAENVLYYLYDNTDFVVEMKYGIINLEEKLLNKVFYETKEIEERISKELDKKYKNYLKYGFLFVENYASTK